MSDHHPYFIIANPTSGRGRGRRMAFALADALRADLVKVDVALTTRPGDAATLARQVIEGGAVRTVVACGGDGTVQQVAAVLAEARRQDGADCMFALAPAGRCNDFARALRIPRDVPGLLRTLCAGRVQAVDLGMLNDRYFCTVATLGLDAEVSDYVERMSMPLRGTPAYLYGAIRVLMRYRPHRVRISGDFGEIDQPVFIATTANTALYGGAIPIVPHASPTDGVLDLCVIDHMPMYRALPFIPQAVLGRHIRRREVRFIASRQFRIECAAPLDLWADGERITATPVMVSVAPAALKVLMPA